MSSGSATETVKMNGHPLTNGIHKDHWPRMSLGDMKRAEQRNIAKAFAISIFCLGLIFLIIIPLGEYMTLCPTPRNQALCISAILMTTSVCVGYIIHTLRNMSDCYFSCL